MLYELYRVYDRQKLASHQIPYNFPRTQVV